MRFPKSYASFLHCIIFLVLESNAFITQTTSLTKINIKQQYSIINRSLIFKNDRKSQYLSLSTSLSSLKEDSEELNSELSQEIQPQVFTNEDRIESYIAVANKAKEDAKVREEEYELKLREQREDLERENNLKQTRLKLMLASTREELSEMEGRVKAFEDTAFNLQEKLGREIEDKSTKLIQLEEELEAKYKIQIEAIENEKAIQVQEAEVEIIELENIIKELKLELTDAKMKSTQLEKETLILEERITTEIENKRIALETLEKDLTETYGMEIDALKAWGEQSEKELEDYKIQMEEQITQIQTENEIQKKSLEYEIDTLTNDLDIVTRKLKNARRYHGKLRREMNKVKQNALMEISKLRMFYEKKLNQMESGYLTMLDDITKTSQEQQELLEKERDGYKIQLDKEIELSEDMRNDLTAKLMQTQSKAEKDITNLQLEWSNRLNAFVNKAEKDKKELLEERNSAVYERDILIETYEEELSSVRKMSKNILQLLKTRTKNRYERFESKFSMAKSTRMKVSQLSKRILTRKNGTLRLPFVKSKTLPPTPPTTENKSGLMINENEEIGDFQ